MTKSARMGRIALGAGVIGLLVSFWLLLPLPAATDIHAARGWGLGAGYVGFILGFPLGIIGVPLLVAIRPFPAGNDASGAVTIASMIAAMVALNWAGLAVLLTSLVRTLRELRAHSRARPPRPSA
ncbi:MAG TPA: hypothetical protein VN602_10420 [Gemmatimonadaceae bacterium]|nr:hypothetical protein [Gemmatimonadaceae bacterium]